jgi:hypothetical protein
VKTDDNDQGIKGAAQFFLVDAYEDNIWDLILSLIERMQQEKAIERR